MLRLIMNVLVKLYHTVWEFIEMDGTLDQFMGKMLIRSSHAMRVIWYWHLRAGLNRNEYTYDIQVSEPNRLLDWNKKVLSYEYVNKYSPTSAIINYLINENFLNPEFKAWLRESGGYKIRCWRWPTPYDINRDCHITFYFRTEAQLALFKLTWL